MNQFDLIPFFPGGKRTIAAYSPNIDRFFLVDSIDAVTVTRAASLLFPKIPLVVMVATEELPFDEFTCLKWTTSNKDTQLAYMRGASLKDKLITKGEMLEAGYPDDVEAVKEDQYFCWFVLRSLRSAIFAQLLNQQVHYGYYARFHPEIDVKDDLLIEVEKILLEVSSIREAQSEFRNLKFVTPETQTTFFDLLGWKP